MPPTVHVELPRRELGAELAEALSARGFRADLIEDGDQCALDVSYAQPEQERLHADVAAAIEGWLSRQAMPLVVEATDDGCVLRPAAT